MASCLDESGTLLSPYYPSMYPNNKECEYTIRQPPGTVITLMIEELDIQNDPICSSDYLEVRKYLICLRNTWIKQNHSNFSVMLRWGIIVVLSLYLLLCEICSNSNKFIHSEFFIPFRMTHWYSLKGYCTHSFGMNSWL